VDEVVHVVANASGWLRTGWDEFGWDVLGWNTARWHGIEWNGMGWSSMTRRGVIDATSAHIVAKLISICFNGRPIMVPLYG